MDAAITLEHEPWRQAAAVAQALPAVAHRDLRGAARGNDYLPPVLGIRVEDAPGATPLLALGRARESAGAWINGRMSQAAHGSILQNHVSHSQFRGMSQG